MKHKIILCVDDEKVVLDSLQRELSFSLDTLYRVELAESGLEALELLEELTRDGYEVPLVISDHLMPGMLGDEFLIKLHSWLPDTRKVMLTGQADSAAVGNAVNRANLYRFISKPWDATDMALTVQSALRSYETDKTLAQQNEELRRLNHDLEGLVQERTTELAQQKHLVEVKNRDVLDSIRHAKRIQDAMLPKPEDLKKVWPESFVYSQPRDIVSGDFFFLSPKRKQLYLAVADCTGHGVPGGFMTFLAYNQLNQIFRELGQLPVHQILDELNLKMLSNLKQAFATHAKDAVPPMDGMDIALIHLDEKTGILTFAGANLPLYHLRGGEVARIRGTVRPIGGTGLMERVGDFHPHTIQLEPGDQIFLTSDGINDQFGGEVQNGFSQKFSTRRLTELIKAIAPLPSAEQADAVGQRMRAWQGHEDQTDDQLMIGLRWAG